MSDEEKKPHVHNFVLNKTTKEIDHHETANVYHVRREFWCDGCIEKCESRSFEQGLKPPKWWNDGEEFGVKK